jgi:hypothetical protein
VQGLHFLLAELVALVDVLHLYDRHAPRPNR